MVITRRYRLSYAFLGPSKELDRFGSHLDLEKFDASLTGNGAHAILNLVPAHGTVAHDDPSLDLGWPDQLLAVELGRPMSRLSRTAMLANRL